MILDEDIKNIANSINLDVFSNKTILVTGSTGLIGSLIVKGLQYCNKNLNSKIKIFALVRDEVKAQKMFDLEDGLELKTQNIEAKIDFSSGLDYIIHCASPTTSKFFIEHPVETINTIVDGTKAMLELAKRYSTKMVYLSSMETYGIFEKEAYVDEKEFGYIDFTAVRSSYSEGKRLAECLCCSYASEYGVDVSIARLSQSFGASVLKNSDQRAFASFAKSVVNNEDIVLHTTGESVRCYIYTTDAVSAVFKLLECGKAGESYNVANEATAASIFEMATILAHDIAKDSIKVVIDIPENSEKLGYSPMSKFKMNTNKLKGLGWEAKISAKEMLRRLVESYKEN